jgi:hypothetical protein
MVIATIHMNGTSAERLIEDLCNASEALDNAYNAMKKAAPNGRDYYPQGAFAIEQATQEHLARLRMVDAVKNEIDRLTIEISDLKDKQA